MSDELPSEPLDGAAASAGRLRGSGLRAARFASTFVDRLFPAMCIGCRRITSRPGTLCAACWPQLRLIDGPICPVYGSPFSEDVGEGMLSAQAIADPPPFRRLRSAALHDGAARRMVSALKYRGRTDLARWMADWMGRAGADLLADAELIVPVPLHRWRYLARRFNQSAELARALSRASGVPMRPEALARRKHTRRQVGLTAKQRSTNVGGAFIVPEERAILVAGRSVLLVDDVYTTGATVRSAVRALKRGGAAHIDVLTFSQVHDRA